MNTPTTVLTVLTLWFVMGLGFLSEYANVRSQGKSHYDAWTTPEGLSFIISIIIPLVILIHKASMG